MRSVNASGQQRQARRIRVLQLITTTVGGAGEYLVRVLDGLDRRRVETVVGFAPGAPLDAAAALRSEAVIHVPWDRRATLSGMLRATCRLTRFIRQGGFDVVVTHTSVAGLVGRIAAWRAGCPVIVHTAHTTAVLAARGVIGRFAYRLAEAALARITTCTVFSSHALEHMVMAAGGARQGRSLTAYHGIDLPRLDRQIEGARQRVREELGLGAGPVVLVAGRLEPAKGVDLALASWPQLRAHHPDAVLLIAGDGPDRADVERLAGPGVRLLGWRTDVPALCAAADVVAVPSRHESFGIIAQEAAAAAVPVVASRVGGLPEVVLDGVTGVLVPPLDPAALASAISALLRDPVRAAALGRAARHMVERRFTGGGAAAAHARLYQRLAHRRQRRG